MRFSSGVKRLPRQSNCVRSGTRFLSILKFFLEVRKNDLRRDILSDPGFSILADVLPDRIRLIGHGHRLSAMSESFFYYHTQIERRYLIILFLSVILYLLALVYLVFPLESDSLRPIGIGAVAVALAIEILVITAASMMTVAVTKQAVALSMFMGIIQVTIALSEVENTALTVSPRTIGWGAETLSGQQVYAITGGDAVMLEMRNRKKVFIASNDAENLHRVIQTVLNEFHSPHQ